MQEGFLARQEQARLVIEGHPGEHIVLQVAAGVAQRTRRPVWYQRRSFLPGLCLACRRSDAATDFSFGLDRGLLSNLDALDATLLLVVIVLSPHHGSAELYAHLEAVSLRRSEAPTRMIEQTF
jgi:hypothetical protein